MTIIEKLYSIFNYELRITLAKRGAAHYELPKIAYDTGKVSREYADRGKSSPGVEMARLFYI